MSSMWDIMKDYIQEHYPEVHRSYKCLRSTILEAWESITHATIVDLRRMSDRYIEVISANGAIQNT